MWLVISLCLSARSAFLETLFHLSAVYMLAEVSSITTSVMTIITARFHGYRIRYSHSSTHMRFFCCVSTVDCHYLQPGPGSTSYFIILIWLSWFYQIIWCYEKYFNHVIPSLSCGLPGFFVLHFFFTYKILLFLFYLIFCLICFCHHFVTAFVIFKKKFACAYL